eukprot:201513-Prymnesium_polylepis.1
MCRARRSVRRLEAVEDWDPEQPPFVPFLPFSDSLLPETAVGSALPCRECPLSLRRPRSSAAVADRH